MKEYEAIRGLLKEAIGLLTLPVLYIRFSIEISSDAGLIYLCNNRPSRHELPSRAKEVTSMIYTPCILLGWPPHCLDLLSCDYGHLSH
jgi:hypothetical protein